VPQGSPAKASLQDVAASLMNSAMQHIAAFSPESASARRCWLLLSCRPRAGRCHH